MQRRFSGSVVFQAGGLIGTAQDHRIHTGFSQTIAVFSGLIQFKTMRIMFDQGNAKSFFFQAGNQFFQIGCFSCT